MPVATRSVTSARMTTDSGAGSATQPTEIQGVAELARAHCALRQHHRHGKRTRGCRYENPIQRPPQSTPAQSAREMTAVTLPERGAFSISFASATFRRTVPAAHPSFPAAYGGPRHGRMFRATGVRDLEPIKIERDRVAQGGRVDAVQCGHGYSSARDGTSTVTSRC